MNPPDHSCPICREAGSYCTLGAAIHRIAMAQAGQRSDAAFNKLQAAGWSIGDIGGVNGWTVYGHRGEQVIDAQGRTQTEAWAAAVEQAETIPTVIVEG
jgi:hypothetical protein